MVFSNININISNMVAIVVNSTIACDVINSLAKFLIFAQSKYNKNMLFL